MRWADPQYLWFLFSVPIVFLYAYFYRELDIPALKFSSYRHLIQPKILINKTLQRQQFILGSLRTLTLIFLILGLARPQKGLKSEEMTTKATDIIVCLDSSRSMLAIDFKPENRFEVAKAVITEFIKGRQYDRIGLVAFAEHAITQCPLTTDKTALLTILESYEVGVIPPDQTAIGVGLATSVNRLKNSKAKSKIIILVTDGANNAGTVDPLTAAKSAAAFGIKIFAIGAGSPGETLIPVDDPRFGRQMVPIRSDLDEDTLLKVASETGGKYFRAKSEGALKSIFKEIDSMEKTDIKVKEYVDYKELYVGFLLFACFFLIIELLLSKTIFRTVP